MINETVMQLQDELAAELPWLNAISSEAEYHDALELISAYTDQSITVQPFLVKIIIDRISEFERSYNESLILKNDNDIQDKGLAALHVLLGHRKLKKLALVDVLGSKSLVSQILNGKRSLTIPHIYALAKFFNVKPSVFL